MYQDVKGIIFDIDGTLADSWKLGFDATVVVLEKNGLDPITERIYHEHTVYCTPERLARHAGLIPGDDDFEAVGGGVYGQHGDVVVVHMNAAACLQSLLETRLNTHAGIK